MRPMHGLTSHVFAATMTFMVLTFPTPQDLFRAVKGPASENAQEIKRFPTLEAYDPPLDTFVSMEDYLPVVAACIAPRLDGQEPTEDCATAIASINPAVGIDEAQRIMADETTIQIATKFYCRAMWAEALRNRRAFDTSTCLQS